MFEISIIIVNYYTEKYILNCIESIIRSAVNDLCEIIIVDNVIENDTFKNELNCFNCLKYLPLNKNYGFGYACNRGAEIASGKAILFLNPDIKVINDSIQKLYEFLFSKNDAGFVTGILTNEYGEIQYFYNNFPGLSWEFKQAFGISLDSKIEKLNNYKKLTAGTPFEIDWAHGACLMIKSDVFNKIAKFDENIFRYYEDVDIQQQTIKLGYKNYCFPDAVFEHFGKSSVRSEEGTKVYYFHMHIAKLYYMKKYYKLWRNIIVRIFNITGFASKIIMLPFRDKYKDIRRLMFSIYLMVILIHLNLKRNL